MEVLTPALWYTAPDVNSFMLSMLKLLSLPQDCNDFDPVVVLWLLTITKRRAVPFVCCVSLIW
jgi:hypothetical protein